MERLTGRPMEWFRAEAMRVSAKIVTLRSLTILIFLGFFSLQRIQLKFFVCLLDF